MTRYEKFIELLEEEDKEEAVFFALNLVESKEYDVVQLYTEILCPSLNNMECKLEDKNICIWKEHIRTGIIRTIVEGCYEEVIKYRDKNIKKNGKTAVVMCPPEEYHDIGARMVADFFTICGFDTIFVGSNTPFNDFYNAIREVDPDIVAISVSNYYNLFSTKKIIDKLKKVEGVKFKIVVGGYAFDKTEENKEKVGADYYAHTFLDIKKISEKEVTG